MTGGFDDKLMFGIINIMDEQFGVINIMNEQMEQNGGEMEVAELAAAHNSSEEGQLTVDVYQTEKEIIIQSAIAGVTSGEMDISIAKDVVTIKGERQKADKVKSSGYFHQEIYWGPFSRSIILPVDIDVNRAKASIKNGLLTIKLPKLENV